MRWAYITNGYGQAQMFSKITLFLKKITPFFLFLEIKKIDGEFYMDMDRAMKWNAYMNAWF